MAPDSKNMGQQQDSSQNPGGSHSQPIQAYFVADRAPTHEGDEISLLEVFRNLVNHWMLIGGVTLGITLAAALVISLTTPIYRSEVLIAPAGSEQSETGVSALFGQFGDIASLGGFNLGGGEDKDKAIAALESRQFTEKFIEDEQLFQVFFAEMWDDSENQWRVENPEDIPTIRDAYKFFDEGIRSVDEDARTGLITLGIEWTDRRLAATWANLLIDRLNEHLRNRAIAETEKSLEFLREELDKTSVAELRQGIYRLIERQVETAMLANVREEYAFEVIDPAVVPDADMYVRPRRIAILWLGLVPGFFLGVILALLRAFILQNAPSVEIDRSGSGDAQG